VLRLTEEEESRCTLCIWAWGIVEKGADGFFCKLCIEPSKCEGPQWNDIKERDRITKKKVLQK
jgi:hypothetical protein